MELDDLKNSWEEVNHEADKKQNITTGMINQITQTKYYSNLKRIAYPEITGMVVCFAGAAYTFANFNKLDTVFLEAAGILSILLLIILPVISLLSLLQFRRRGDVNKSYAETLKEFAIKKIRFYKFQKINLTLSYLLLVAVIILLPKFFGGKDISDNKYFWMFAFCGGYIFLLFFSRWISKYYTKTLRQTEDLLKELASE